MGIFRKDTPEEKAHAKRVEELNEFYNSPAGRAQGAYKSGLMFYEVNITLEDFKGIAGISSSTSNTDHIGRMLTDVCEQGWELFDVGYQFKFYEAFSGSAGNIGLVQYKGKSQAHYLFKRNETNRKVASSTAVKPIL